MENSRKTDVGQFAAIGDLSVHLRHVDEVVRNATEALKSAVADDQNRVLSMAQGFYAEHYHAETFNIDAALKRLDNLKANAPRSNTSMSPDIEIRDHGRQVREYSLKYLSTARQSVDEQKGYEDQGRIIPSDQYDEAKEHLRRQIPRELAKEGPHRRQVAKDLQEVEKHLDSRIKHHGVESKGLDRKESEQHVKRLRRGEDIPIEPQYDLSVIAREALRSGVIAGGITLAMALAPRVYGAVAYRVRHGDFPPDVFDGVFHDAAASSGMAGLRATVATSITLSAKAGLFGHSLKTINPTLVGTLTYLTFEGVKDYRRFIRNEISGVEFADSMMFKSAAAVGGAVGAGQAAAIIGQSAIPIPVVGALVGAMVGSVLASQGYKCLDYVNEAYFHSEEFEELKQVTAQVADQWNLFVADYAGWKRSSRAFAALFERQEAALSTLDEDSSSLDAQVQQMLEE